MGSDEVRNGRRRPNAGDLLAYALWLGLAGGGVAIVVSGATTLTAHGRMNARTTGTVVGLSDAPDYQHRSYYFPVVEISVDGESHRFVGGVEQQGGTVEVGDTVEVVYDASAPDNGELADSVGDFQPLAEITIGSIMSLLALVLAVRALRRRRAS